MAIRFSNLAASLSTKAQSQKYNFYSFLTALIFFNICFPPKGLTLKQAYIFSKISSQCFTASKLTSKSSLRLFIDKGEPTVTGK
jgi:hypothetical protein